MGVDKQIEAATAVTALLCMVPFQREKMRIRNFLKNKYKSGVTYFCGPGRIPVAVYYDIFQGPFAIVAQFHSMAFHYSEEIWHEFIGSHHTASSKVNHCIRRQFGTSK
jgi:hypothetical protein